MAKANVLVGKGTKVEFLTYGFIGQGTDLDWPDMGTVEDIPSTNFDSDQPSDNNEWGGMEYEPTVCGDPGTITMTLDFDLDASLPPLGKKDTIRVTLPLKKGYSSAAIYSGDGYLKSASMRTEVQGKWTQSVVIRCSGVWKKTPAVKVA